MNKHNQSNSAIRWSAVSAIFRGGLQVLQVGILARLLAPEDYGMMAMVMVVLSTASLFADFGLGAALMHHKNVTLEERSSIYWLNAAIGFALMLFVIALSPLVAIFFKHQQLIPLLCLAATNFTVQALGQQLKVEAEKDLNFKPVILIELVAALSGFIAAVMVAALSYGVYALVISAMVNVWVANILFWKYLSRGWRPQMRLKFHDVKRFLKFGSGMVLNNILNHVNSTIDLVLCGRLLGVAQLGVFSLPRNLTLQVQMLVNPIFVRVGFPLIASAQADVSRVKSIYLMIMNHTASVNAPIYICMLFFSNEIVWVLFGSNWIESVPLLQLLAVWGLFRSFGNPVGSLLFGMGRVGLSTKWNLGMVFVTLPMIWLGSNWEALGVAYAMAALMALLFYPSWLLLVHPVCGAGFWEYFQQILIPTSCALVSAFIGFWITISFDIPLFRLMLGTACAGIIYFMLSYWFNRGFISEYFGSAKIQLW